MRQPILYRRIASRSISLLFYPKNVKIKPFYDIRAIVFIYFSLHLYDIETHNRMQMRTIITHLFIAMATIVAIANPHSTQLSDNSLLYQEPYTILPQYDEDEIAFSITTATTSFVTAEADNYSQIDNYDDDDEEIEYIPAGKRKKKKKRSFNSPRTKSFWGFVAGYTSKLWSKETPDGNVTNVGLFDSSWLHGIQFGIRYNPLFKYGFGLNTGLYYEYYHYKSALIEDFNAAEQYYYYNTLNEHAIRFPLHVEYRLNFAKSFQLFFYGGFTAEYAFLGNMSKTRQGEYTPFEDNKDIYGSIIPSGERYNVAFSYGGGIRIGAIQFNVSTEKGLINVSPSKEYVLKQNKPLNIAMSIMF